MPLDKLSIQRIENYFETSFSKIHKISNPGENVVIMTLPKRKLFLVEYSNTEDIIIDFSNIDFTAKSEISKEIIIMNFSSNEVLLDFGSNKQFNKFTSLKEIRCDGDTFKKCTIKVIDDNTFSFTDFVGDWYLIHDNDDEEFLQGDHIPIATIESIYDLLDIVFETFSLGLNEPTGFVNRTDSTISYDPITRTFNIQPAVDDYVIYYKGSKITKNSLESCVHDDINGLWYFYFDKTTFAISSSQTYPFDHIVIAIINYYYDNDTLNGYNLTPGGVFDERHGTIMDKDTHSLIHNTTGALYSSGFDNSNITWGSGANNADAQFTISPGYYYDEDIRHFANADGKLFGNGTYNVTQILNTLRCDVFFKIGPQANPQWVLKKATLYPMIYGGTEVYNGTVLTGTEAKYNTLLFGNWILNSTTNNYLFYMHYFVCGKTIFGVCGENQYNNQGSAQSGYETEIGNFTFTNFLFQECYVHYYGNIVLVLLILQKAN
jgi:hypothetical protein